MAFYPPRLRGCVGSGCPLTSEPQRPRDHKAVRWGESTKGVAAVVLGGGGRACDHIAYEAGKRAKCHGDGDALLHFVMHGGADAWRWWVFVIGPKDGCEGSSLPGPDPPQRMRSSKSNLCLITLMSKYITYKVLKSDITSCWFMARFPGSLRNACEDTFTLPSGEENLTQRRRAEILRWSWKRNRCTYAAAPGKSHYKKQPLPKRCSQAQTLGHLTQCQKGFERSRTTEQMDAAAGWMNTGLRAAVAGAGLLTMLQPAGGHRHRRACTTSVQTHHWQRGACPRQRNGRASCERRILLKVFRIYVGVWDNLLLLILAGVNNFKSIHLLE